MADSKLTANQIHQREVRRLLSKAAPRAISKLVSLIDSENDALAFQAAKAVLDWQIAKPKEVAPIQVNVQQTSNAAHLAALAARVVQEADGQPVNLLITQDNPASSGKLSINHGPIIDAVPVSATADSQRDGD